MPTPSALPAGFVAGSVAPGVPRLDVERAARLLGDHPRTLVDIGDVCLVLCGLEVAAAAAGNAVLLSRAPRRQHSDLDPAAAAQLLLDGERSALPEVLPPFAALTWGGSVAGLIAGVDPLGFRHLYYRQAAGWAAVSTSARALASCGPAGIDRTAVGVQSLLGWQVGLRTPFAQVLKVPPGSVLTLRDGQVSIQKPAAWQTGTGARSEADPLSLDSAVDDAAAMLREYLRTFLDDHPDAVLQLTGGQDSRILLGAIPPARRRGLRVMTLAVPGSPDLAIAADLARRYGMDHDVVDLSGLEAISPTDAHELAVAAARRLECSADPLAWASVAWAEAKVEQRPRLSGLGGEVARGFYYLGPARAAPVTRQRVQRLAEWRMFTNEAADPDALEPDFARWARQTVVDELYSIFASYGPDWLTATDEFYLGQRMHRWAGVLATATCLDRIVVNPMLDHHFLDLVRALAPRDKQSSRFLARLSCRLDDELSSIPLDGRPAPRVYAYPNVRNYATLATMTGRKIAGKLRQRALRVRRPPVGGEILATKIAEFYREHPATLEGVSAFGVFRSGWLEKVTVGATPLNPAAAALLVNLEVVATDAL